MRITCLLPLLLAACATNSTPYAPVRDVSYQALGAEPFWTLAIGDNRIVLRTAEQPTEQSWPRTLPRIQDGARIWQSGEGAYGIVVEARPGPCTSESEQVYADDVRVRARSIELTGCGGRLIRSAE
jgi:uncharacterized membrane protein